MKFYCEICDYTEYKKSNYIRHLNTLTHINTNNEKQGLPIVKKPKKQHKCTVCDYQTTCKSNFNRHSASHKAVINTSKCLACDFETNKQTEWENHCVSSKHKQKVLENFPDCIGNYIDGIGIEIAPAFGQDFCVNPKKTKEYLKKEKKIVTNKKLKNTTPNKIKNAQDEEKLAKIITRTKLGFMKHMPIINKHTQIERCDIVESDSVEQCKYIIEGCFSILHKCNIDFKKHSDNISKYMENPENDQWWANELIVDLNKFIVILRDEIESL